MPTVFSLAVYPTVLCQRTATGAFIWTANDVRCCLGHRHAWSPDPTDPGEIYVADAISGGFIEMTAAGYARDTLTSPTTTLDFSTVSSILDGDQFAFGSPAAGQAYNTAILFEHITNDASSPMIAAIDLGAQTTDGNPITLSPDPSFGFVQHIV